MSYPGRYHKKKLATAEQRFWDKVLVDRSSECWIWTASFCGAGYGKFWDGNALVSSHRFSYELQRGPIPDGFDIDHLCTNTACVNVDHLEAVTRSENLFRRAPLYRAAILSDMCREERDEWLHDEEERAGDERMEHEYGKPRDKETP